MQSPAFHPCPSIYTLYSKSPKKDIHIYLSYGTGNDTEDQDLPMIKILKKKGYSCKIDIIKNGNHDWKQWKPQLPTILKYFYGKNK